MDNLLAELAEAKQHIEAIDQQIARQRMLIATLSAHDTCFAEQESVLAQLQHELLRMRELVAELHAKIGFGGH